MSLTPRLDRLERNVVINGNFDYWQRGTSFTGITGNAIYHADRWNLTRGAGISSLVNTVERSTDVPSLAQSGFVSAFSYRLSNTAAASNLATSGTSVGPTCHIEGNNIHRLIGKTVNLSFWVKSSVTGTYSFTFGRNFNDTYTTTYTINSANTWEKKYLSVYLDPSLAWNTSNGRGLMLYWVLGAGTAVTTSSINQWLVASGVVNASGATNTFANTNGATFYLSQVMLTDAEQDLDGFARAGTDITEEFQLCQRYYQRLGRGVMGGSYSATQWTGAVNFSVPMRASPTLSLLGNVTVHDPSAATYAQSSPSIVASYPNSTTFAGFAFLLGNFTGMTAFRPMMIQNDEFLAFDAEL